ncbi:unnamed protein product [Brachionus calyciflorus]|uniref:Uncharacterized protein n=1 Tax=Brachionus calyciflorus TaxID=104777 RepID=A0A814JGP6_9BILA|nr:unnamed protein product [Brachionus calyciflorus]
MSDLSDDDWDQNDSYPLEYSLKKKVGEALLVDHHVYNFHSPNDDGSLYCSLQEQQCQESRPLLLIGRNGRGRGRPRGSRSQRVTQEPERLTVDQPRASRGRGRGRGALRC